MRHTFIMASVLLALAVPASAQVSVGIAVPGLSIGINLPTYPELVRVPGQPVYYAPGVRSNYFFYDGMYWVFEGDDWYASTWYNGPWGRVSAQSVPVYVLRVPVRYYRSPPPYFRGWRNDAAPRWGEHWGPAWQQDRRGWDQPRHDVPAPAPLPRYQRQYPTSRYPQPEQQQLLRNQHYRYTPGDPVVRQHFEAPPTVVTQPPQGNRPRDDSRGMAPRREPQHPPGQGQGKGQGRDRDRDRDDDRGQERKQH